MVVVWRVTEQCNLGCHFCAYDSKLQRPRQNADVGRILSFGPVLADFMEKTGQQLLVAWHGGEPLLWNPLELITTNFRQKHGIRISTTTNGTPLAVAAVRKHLLREYGELTISVDAMGDHHDRLRGWPGGFAELRQNVMQFAGELRRSSSSLRLRANVVLMRATIGQFGKLCRELAGWGIQEVTFNQLGGNDRPEFYQHNRLLPEQVERLALDLPGIRQVLAGMGLQISGSNSYLGRLKASANDQRIAVGTCDSAKRFLFIDERGIVAPCSFTAREFGLPIESITSAAALEGLVDVFSEKQRRLPANACADCHSTQLFEKFCKG